LMALRNYGTLYWFSIHKSSISLSTQFNKIMDILD
jgi:hypothetical protein